MSTSVQEERPGLVSVQLQSLLLIGFFNLFMCWGFSSLSKVFWVSFQTCASVLCHLQLEVRDVAGCFYQR